MASRQSMSCRACSTVASSSSHRVQQKRTFTRSLVRISSSSSSPSTPASLAVRSICKHLQPLRLSTHFSPTQKASQSVAADDSLPSLQLLLRGGYIRSSSSGIFTLLPNALRIVRKITCIIDQELTAISASRLSLPNLLPSKLWHQTGRYHVMGSELYKLRDRKDSEFVLGPTHEEEITKLVAHEVDSDRQLPLRLYQVTTKFRDEPRPRMGLLRTKEFLMKDLYSFDKTESDAKRTYELVMRAYARIFDRVLGIGNWKAAVADTGAIGGNQSHEYHVEDAAGEDTLLSCTKCSYTANMEKAVSMPAPAHMPVSAAEVRVLLFGCKDVKVQGQVMHAVVLPLERQLNETKLDKLIAKLKVSAEGISTQGQKADNEAITQDKIELLYDSASSDAVAATGATWDWKDRPEGPLVRFSSLSVLADFECASLDPAELNDALVSAVNKFTSRPGSPSTEAMPLVDLFPSQFGQFASNPASVTPPLALLDIRTAEADDTCPSCKSVHSLRETRAIEIGHTFYLGERYSRALEAGFLPSAEAKAETEGVEKLPNGRVPFQMGCYGIGVSRILGALAQKAAADFDGVFAEKRDTGLKQLKHRKSGFIWPNQVAPFTGVIVIADTKDANKVRAAEQVFQRIINRARRVDQSVREVLSDIVRQYAEGQGGLGKSETAQEGEDGRGWSSEEAQELVIDDRNATLGSKLADSDLMGYAFRLIIGKHFTPDVDHASDQGKIELQYIRQGAMGWNSILLPIISFGEA